MFDCEPTIFGLVGMFAEPGSVLIHDELHDVTVKIMGDI
jgi:hypothetical protein